MKKLLLACLLFVSPCFIIQDTYTTTPPPETDWTEEEEVAKGEGEIKKPGLPGEETGTLGSESKEAKNGSTKKFVAKFQKAHLWGSMVPVACWLLYKGIKIKEGSDAGKKIGMLLFNTFLAVSLSTVAGYGLDKWYRDGPPLSPNEIIAGKVSISAITALLVSLQLIPISRPFTHPIVYTQGEQITLGLGTFVISVIVSLSISSSIASATKKEKELKKTVEITKLKAKEEAIVAVAEEIERLEQEVKDLKEKIQTLKDEKAIAKIEADTTIEGLERKIQTLQDEKATIKTNTDAKIKGLEKKIQTLQNEKATTKTATNLAMKELEGRIQTLQGEKATAKTEVNLAMKELEGRIQTLQNEKATTKTATNLAMKELEGRIQTLQGEKTTAEKATRTANTTIQTLADEITDLKKKIKDLKAEKESTNNLEREGEKTEEAPKDGNQNKE